MQLLMVERLRRVVDLLESPSLASLTVEPLAFLAPAEVQRESLLLPADRGSYPNLQSRCSPDLKNLAERFREQRIFRHILGNGLFFQYVVQVHEDLHHICGN